MRSFASNEVLIGVEVLVIVAIGVTDDVVKFNAVAEESTNATKALDELESIGRLVSNEFDELINSDPGWHAVYNRSACKRIDLPDADQTFSDRDSRARVNEAILNWVAELSKD